MNNFFRALIAGYGAKKLGGGCLGTVLVFILIWVALGQCSMKERDESFPPLENQIQVIIKDGNTNHHLQQAAVESLFPV